MPLFTLLSVQVCPPFFQPLCAERDARERIPQTEKGGIANADRKRNGLPSPNAIRPPSLSCEAITPLEDKDECPSWSLLASFALLVRLALSERGVLLGLKTVLFDGIPAGIPPAT